MKPFFGKTIGVLVVCTILCGATYGAEENEAVANTELRLDQKIEDITVSGIDLAQLLSLLQEQTGVALVIGHGSDKKVTFSLTKPTLRDTLFAALYPVGLGYRVRPNGAVVIDEEAELLKDFGPGPQSPAVDPQSKEKTLAAINRRMEDLTVSGVDLSQLLTLLQAQTGAQMVLGEGIVQKVTFNLSQPTLREILDTVLPLYDLGYRIRDNGVLIIDRESRLASMFGSAPEQNTPSDVVTLELQAAKHPIVAYIKALEFYSKNLNCIVSGDQEKQTVTVKALKKQLGELQKILDRIESEEFIFAPDDVKSESEIMSPKIVEWIVGFLPEKMRIDEIKVEDSGLSIAGSQLIRPQFEELVGKLNEAGKQGYQPFRHNPPLQFQIAEAEYSGLETKKETADDEKSGFCIRLEALNNTRRALSTGMSTQMMYGTVKPQPGRGYKISFLTKDIVGLMAYDGKEGFYQVGDVVQESVFGNFKIESINPNPQNPWIRVKGVESGDEAQIAAR